MKQYRRPDDWTPERQAQADARRTARLASGVLPPECREEAFTEIWYAHFWLMDALEAAGCPEDGCLAASKSIPMAGNPWPTAHGILDGFMAAKQQRKNIAESN